MVIVLQEKEVEKKKEHPSVTRTFRFSTALDDALTEKAGSKGIGKNTLVTSILKKYVEWDSVVEVLGYTSVPKEAISSLIQSLDKDSAFLMAKQIAKGVASSLPLWFGLSNLDNLLMYFEVSSKFGGLWVRHRTEKQDGTIRIIVYQPFSEIGAAWEKGFLTGLVEGALGFPPNIIGHADSIEAIIELKE
jgi:hypothetical protein